MKCDLCSWQQKPESFRHMEMHLNDHHRMVEGLCVVWKDGQMTCTDNPGNLHKLEVPLPNTEIPENPPVVVHNEYKPNVTVTPNSDAGRPTDHYSTEVEMG